MKQFPILSRFSFLALISGALLMGSCKKQDTPAPVEANSDLLVETATMDMEVQAGFDEVFDNVAGIDGVSAGEDLGIYGGSGFGLFPARTSGTTQTRCFTVTVTPRERGVFPKTVTLDFGTGCEINGHVRKGKIITVYSGPLHIPGSKAVTELDGYQVDGRSIEGRFVIQNTTEPGSNQRRFSRSVTNAKMTHLATGKWKMWSGVMVMLQVEGNGTPLWPADDVYQLTGRREGQNSEGRKWVAETASPLVKAFACRWISQGILKVSVSGTVGELNYGDGTCDNEATLTINGRSRTLKLG